MVIIILFLALFAAVGPVRAQTVQVTDLAVAADFQDHWLGHFKHGRAGVAADFDLDGRIDFFIGNPNDESFVIRNVPDGVVGARFELVQILLTDELAWGGAAADYDNDGDYDLFVSVGGNEGVGFDRLYRNRWVENGGTLLEFEDVSDAAGIRGPVPPGSSAPIPIASANAVWVDYDRDGNVDLFVNGFTVAQSLPELLGRNVLWRNNGDGTFADVTDATGLSTSLRRTKNSSFLDIDNDGDLDLYETNLLQRNVLWRNRLVETGTATFEDVTATFSDPPFEDLGYPLSAFASGVADFNNDGWQDLIVFLRDSIFETGSPYAPGHALYLNDGGTGFTNVAEASGINDPLQTVLGVMGCQVGDVDGNGVPDVFLGNGGPDGGQYNLLFFGSSGHGAPPVFTNRSELIDSPAPVDPDVSHPYPPYPYRTHGTCVVDVDGDGLPEMTVVNGGMHDKPDPEPNRLFKFDWQPRPNFFRVRPVGNGITVSRDAIGTRLALTVSKGGGSPWTVFGTLLGGSGFSAQNGFDVFFGLDDADTIHSLEILWPDGATETLTAGLFVNDSVAVQRDAVSGDVAGPLNVSRQGAQLMLSWDPSCGTLDSDYAVYRGTLGEFTSHQPVTCSTGGEATHTTAAPAENAYYLVVPRNLQSEGSYGRGDDGAERAPAAAACLPQSLGACE